MSFFTVNIERFLINFGMVYNAIAMYQEIRNNVIRDDRVNEYFLNKWRHIPCDMRSSITPSLSILNIWRRGVWQPWENHRLLLFDDMGTHDYNINREF